MKWLLTYMLVVMLAGCTALPQNHVLADGNQVTDLQYLERNFDQFYVHDYAGFWSILHSAASRARNCRKLADTAEFFGLAKINSHNAEFNQFLNKEIEQIAIDNTECFLSALNNVTENVQNGIFKRLEHPLFVESSDIVRALIPFERSEYMGLVKRYLRTMR